MQLGQSRDSNAYARDSVKPPLFVRAKLTDGGGRRKEKEEANGAQRSQLNYSRLSISHGARTDGNRPQSFLPFSEFLERVRV